MENINGAPEPEEKRDTGLKSEEELITTMWDARAKDLDNLEKELASKPELEKSEKEKLQRYIEETKAIMEDCLRRLEEVYSRLDSSSAEQPSDRLSNKKTGSITNTAVAPLSDDNVMHFGKDGVAYSTAEDAINSFKD